MENYIKSQLTSNINTLEQYEDLPFTDFFYLNAVLESEVFEDRSLLWRKYQSAIQKQVNQNKSQDIDIISNADTLYKNGFESSKFKRIIEDLDAGANVHYLIARAAGLRYFCENGHFPLKSKHPMMFYNIEVKDRVQAINLINDYINLTYPDLSKDNKELLTCARLSLYKLKWSELVLNYKIKTNLGMLKQAVEHLVDNQRLTSLDAREKAYLTYNITQVYLQPQNRPRIEIEGPHPYLDVFDFTKKALNIDCAWFHDLKGTYELLDWTTKTMMDLKFIHAMHSKDPDNIPNDELDFEF